MLSFYFISTRIRSNTVSYFKFLFHLFQISQNIDSEEIGWSIQCHNEFLTQVSASLLNFNIKILISMLQPLLSLIILGRNYTLV